jgi:PncC family amidohydrolase
MSTLSDGQRPDPLALQAGKLLVARCLTLCTAESCTGGLIASLLTDVAGSSGYFLGSAVTYANSAKVGLVGVRPETLEEHGAVSPETAREMAQGARRVFGADLAVAVTGIAGPGGGSPDKPVGLTYIHLLAPGADIGERHLWSGDRLSNKLGSAEAALTLLVRYLEG